MMPIDTKVIQDELTNILVAGRDTVRSSASLCLNKLMDNVHVDGFSFDFRGVHDM